MFASIIIAAVESARSNVLNYYYYYTVIIIGHLAVDAVHYNKEFNLYVTITITSQSDDKRQSEVTNRI